MIIPVRDIGVEILGQAYISLVGISIKYPSEQGIYITYPNHVWIQNIDILYAEQGIDVYSPGELYDYLYINNNNISQTQKDGISIWGSSHCEILNNTLTNIGSNETSPRVGNGIWIGNADYLVVSGNKIDRVSYNGICISGNYITISRNIISNCQLLFTDGGGIYTAAESVDFNIENNIINKVTGNSEGTPYSEEPGGGVGIYLDEISAGIKVSGNIVYDCYYGILLNRAHNNLIINNSLYNNTKGICLEERSPNEMYENNIYNNILLCSKPEQTTWYESVTSDSTSMVKGQYDYNLHYNPFQDNVIEYGSSTYSLNTWSNLSGQDKHSLMENPLFMDVVNYDFHLQSASPCIDKGIIIQNCNKSGTYLLLFYYAHCLPNVRKQNLHRKF